MAIPAQGREFSALARIALPLAAAYLADLAMYATDMAIVGRLGPLELAAVGLAGDIFWQLALTCGGTLSIVGVQISGALAREDLPTVREVCAQGLWLAMLIGAAGTLVTLQLDRLLALLGQDPAVVRLVGEYVGALAWTFVPALLFLNQRLVAAAFDRASWVMAITLAAVALNALLTYSLVFGALGLPALGVAGAGWATTIVSLFMAIALGAALLLSPALRPYRLYAEIRRPVLRLWGGILKLGLPIGGIEIMEHGMFSTVAIMMGWIGATVLAANQIIFLLCGLPILIAYAIGEAAAIRVASNMGAGNPAAARRAGFFAIALVSVVMLSAAAVYLGVPELLVSLLLGEIEGGESEEVLALTSELLLIAAFFQLFDGWQAVASRALRGLQDVVVPLWLAAFGYWGCGVGVGYLLAFPLGFGPYGLWLGMAGGLTAAGSLMVWRFHRLTGRRIAAQNAPGPASVSPHRQG